MALWEQMTYFDHTITNDIDSHLELGLSKFNGLRFTMIICVCRRVSDKAIALHASEGKDFEDIQFDLGVATQCGRCEDCARNIVEQCHAKFAMTHGGWMPAPLVMGR